MRYGMSSESGYISVMRPLEQVWISFDPEVIDRILAELQRSSEINPKELDLIQPAQLQLVIDSLYSLQERQGSPEKAFTANTYEGSGGVSKILQEYLSRSLQELGSQAK